MDSTCLKNITVHEISVGINLFESLINRAIFNYCSIILFEDSNPEKFALEVADLARKHSDTVTIYKTLEGKVLFASDLHFNPYRIQVMASVSPNVANASIEDAVGNLKNVLEDREFRNKKGNILEVNRVKWLDEYNEGEIKFTVYENQEKYDAQEGNKEERVLEGFENYLKNEGYDTADIEVELSAMMTELNDAINEEDELKGSEEYGTAKAILMVIDENQDGVQRIYKDYSGRGMYGRKCFGIVVDGSSYDNFMSEFSKMGVGASGDNMGLDMIIYWPSYSFDEIAKADDEMILVGIKGAKDEDDDEDDETVSASAKTAVVDCSLYIEEDEGNTTRYSGYVRIDTDKEITCTGTDRGDRDWFYKMADELAAKLNIEIGDYDHSYNEDEYQDALNVALSKSVGGSVEVSEKDGKTLTIKSADGSSEVLNMQGSETTESSVNRIDVDCTNFQEADDGNTTTFGGQIKVGDRVFDCHGNDRGSNTLDEIEEFIVEQLGFDISSMGVEDQYNLTEPLTDGCFVAGNKYIVSRDGNAIKVEKAGTTESAYDVKKVIENLEEAGFYVLDEGAGSELNIYISNSAEDFAKDIYVCVILENGEFVDKVDSGDYAKLYPNQYANIESAFGEQWDGKGDKVTLASNESYRNIQYVRKPESINQINKSVRMDSEIAKLPVYQDTDLFGEPYRGVTQEFLDEVRPPQYFVMKVDDKDILVDTQGANYVRYAVIIDTDLSDDFDKAKSCESERPISPEYADTENNPKVEAANAPVVHEEVLLKGQEPSFANPGWRAGTYTLKVLELPTLDNVADRNNEVDYKALILHDPGYPDHSGIKDVLNMGRIDTPYVGVKTKEEAIKLAKEAFQKMGKTEASGKLQWKKDFIDEMGSLGADPHEDGVLKCEVAEDNELDFYAMVYAGSEDMDEGFICDVNGNPEVGFPDKDSAKENAEEKYAAIKSGKTEALHPTEKGGEEVKLHRIKDKHIDTILANSTTGLAKHALLDPELSDLNKEQIAAVRKAIVEVGHRNMGHNRSVDDDSKKGSVGSDIAEFAAWITSDCMGNTADYLMDSVGNRNAKDTYLFVKDKLENCLLDFYRVEVNKSNFQDVYDYWYDLLYNQKKALSAMPDKYKTKKVKDKTRANWWVGDPEVVAKHYKVVLQDDDFQIVQELPFAVLGYDYEEGLKFRDITDNAKLEKYCKDMAKELKLSKSQLDYYTKWEKAESTAYTEEDDFSTFYFKEPLSDEQMKELADNIAAKFKTETSVVDDSALNVYHMNVNGIADIAQFIGQNKIVEIA